MAFPFDDGDEVYLGGELGAGYSQTNADLDRDIGAFYQDDGPVALPDVQPQQQATSCEAKSRLFMTDVDRRVLANRINSEWRTTGRFLGNDPLDYYLTCEGDAEERLKRKREADDVAAMSRLTDRLQRSRAKRMCLDVADENAGGENDGSAQASSCVNGPSTSMVFKYPPTRTDDADLDWTAVSAPDGDNRHYVLLAYVSSSASVGDARRLPTRGFGGTSSAGRGGRAGARTLTGVDFRKTLADAEELLEKEQKQSFADNEDSADSLIDSIAAELAGDTEGGKKTAPPPDTNNNSAQTSLWVDKYRPRVYTDLLSDDGVNRTLLTWLKLWDQLVFGIKPRPKPTISELPTEEEEAEEYGKAGKKQWEAGKKPWEKKKDEKKPFGTDWKAEIEMTVDATKRPEFRIALLCGPPGLGKTTLANIIARHCGYNILEMNASDDRTVADFESRIEGGLTSNRTVGADPRPNCLIIDEIDGAPSASVKYLVNLIRGGVSKHKRKLLLKRPIICICNDLYSASLRELRKLALVLAFPVTGVKRLTERLNFVCTRELVTPERSALEALCEKTRQDIRACLNTLQFSSRRKTPSEAAENALTTNDENGDGRVHLTLADVQAAADKDDQRTLFQLWKMVFEMPRHKTRRVGDSSGVDESLQPANRFKHILSAAYACGEYDKVSRGYFANYLSVKNRETTMDKICMGIDCLALDDLVSLSITSQQNFTLMRYQPYLSVMFHFLFATTQYVNVQYPQQQMQQAQKLQRSNDTLDSVLDVASSSSEASDRPVCNNTTTASVRVFNEKTSLVLDTLPYVARIVQPNIRPVNSQLYSAKELAQLRSVVDAMLSYNLDYHQQRNVDGQYVFLMEPPIEELLKYTEGPSVGELSYSARQIIHREIGVESVRRAEAARKASGAGVVGEKKNALPCQRVKPKAPAPVPPAASGPVTAKDSVQTDLASIFCSKSRQQSLSMKPVENTVSAGRYDLWFKFNAGYSNAIRKTIKMKDLLT